MYKIRGGDGKEYGPVPADTLRAWVNQGRANGQTQVQAEGTSDWRALGSLPDFADLFAASSSPGPAAPVAGVPVPTSGMATWSLVLGISSFFCGITAIPGLILGIIALKQIKESAGRLGGRGLALGGTITSAIALLLVPIAFLAAMLLPALAKAKSKAQTINCVNNVKQLALAVRIYSSDNNENFPAGTNWCDALNQYVGAPKVYQCPSDAAQQLTGYAFNAKLSALAEKDIPPDTVMIFESDFGWNANGGKELMIARPRHGGRYVIGLADGSVQQMSEAQIGNLRWDPKTETSNSNP